MLIWNVFVEDVNARQIKLHNVFDHAGFMDDCKKAYKDFKDDREAFLEQVKRSLQYYYWSKCEWEVVISELIHGKSKPVEKKIDVYDQVEANWDRFAEYVWENREEFKVKRGRKKSC